MQQKGILLNSSWRMLDDVDKMSQVSIWNSPKSLVFFSGVWIDDKGRKSWFSGRGSGKNEENDDENVLQTLPAFYGLKKNSQTWILASQLPDTNKGFQKIHEALSEELQRLKRNRGRANKLWSKFDQKGSSRSCKVWFDIKTFSEKHKVRLTFLPWKHFG